MKSEYYWTKRVDRFNLKGETFEMRKKLSLFLVMLMALTMVLGTGITAMAEEPPEGAPQSVRPCSDTPEYSLYYVLENSGGKRLKL